jgi:cytochrome P450
MLEDPYPFYEELRGAEPVCPIPRRDPAGRLTYLVTKRKDIDFILLHPQLFSNAGRSPTKSYPGQQYPTGIDLSNTDPPDHKALKQCYLTLLAPRHLESLKPRIYEKANELIDAFADRDEVELRAAYARPLPTWFMGQLLGVPAELHWKLERWAFDYFELLDSNVHRTKEWGPLEEELQQSYVDFMNFCGDLVVGWRENRPDGVLGDFAYTRNGEGELYTVDELANQVRLFISGAQTTIESIAKAVVDYVQLEEKPDLGDDDYMQRFVEESIRLDGPATYLPRIVLEDVELSGVEVRAGSRLLISLQSGNRDEELFECPEAFDADRPNVRRHIGFGMGIHMCVGAGTARLETTVALRALVSRFRELRLSPKNTFEHRTDLTQMRQFKEVHLELTPR